ncbi:hypothetical protein DAEQUDRAFT_722080 [Daedalea quercina L-15889]|uniref:Uncharacterized protein n=1 Tax=Daedalea quercina L-15889 TaxID=1314783 RepID=A0A165T689_9APHY|nr:hypothetical protein DAEQUDRAFT_722080 [Daedalea quercina L-15889]
MSMMEYLVFECTERLYHIHITITARNTDDWQSGLRGSREVACSVLFPSDDRYLRELSPELGLVRIRPSRELKNEHIVAAEQTLVCARRATARFTDGLFAVEFWDPLAIRRRTVEHERHSVALLGCEPGDGPDPERAYHAKQRLLRGALDGGRKLEARGYFELWGRGAERGRVLGDAICTPDADLISRWLHGYC